MKKENAKTSETSDNDSLLKKALRNTLEFVDPSLKNLGKSSPERDIKDAKSITTPSYEVSHKKGGKVDLKNCKVSTHQKSKSCKDW